MTVDPSADEMVDALAAYSASLPAICGLHARPWNGRALTRDERRGALCAYNREWRRTRSLGLAAQAAHEYLSDFVW